jgi:UDP-glucose 4-epimerase
VDCRDKDAVEYVFNKFQPKLVFHLAANAAENKSQFSPIDITSRNYTAFLNVLVSGIRHGMKRIVVTSSNAVYGNIKTPFRETDTPEPEDLYGLSKLMLEKTLEILAKVHKFEYVIARPHNVYGPRQCMSDPYRNVIMIWMNKLLLGENYTIYGDGSMVRCYTYIDDLVDGLYKLGFKRVNGEIFNLGSDEEVTLKQLSDVIQTTICGMLPPNFLPARPQEVPTAVPNHDKAKLILKYKTRTTLSEGIAKTWEWVQQQGPVSPIYTELELTNNKVPSNWINKK